MKIIRVAAVFLLFGFIQEHFAYSIETDDDDEDSDFKDHLNAEIEKPFCRGSQCRKEYSTHSQHMQAYAEMKKGQKQKDAYSRIRTGVIPTTGPKDPTPHYEQRKSALKPNGGSKVTKRPNLLANHAEQDRVGPSGNQHLSHQHQVVHGQNQTWQRTTILSGLVKQNSNGKQQTLADLFKELVAGANGSKKKQNGNPGKNSDIQAMPSEIRTNVQTVNYLGRHGVSNLTARPPFNFVEDSGSRTSEADKTTESGKQQQQHQPPLFTLEHPFANQAFYDDDDYIENESKEEQRQQQQQLSAESNSESTTEPSSFLSIFGPLYDPVKMKLNLPSDVSKTLTSAATPTATASSTTTATTNAVDNENGLYTSFLNTVLVNRPIFPGPTDLTATATTTAAATSSPLTKQSTTSSSISNIEDWYMKYMSKILESSSTEQTPTTTSSTSPTTPTAIKSSSPIPLDLFEEGLNMEFQSSTTEDSLGIRDELQQILSSLPGSGIMMAAAAAANSPTATMMTCPSTCTCSCPSPNLEELSNIPDSQLVPVVMEDKENGKMPSIILQQVDPNDEDSKKKVNLDISLLPCARTATYQLSLALKLCRK